MLIVCFLTDLEAIADSRIATIIGVIIGTGPVKQLLFVIKVLDIEVDSFRIATVHLSKVRIQCCPAVQLLYSPEFL